MEACLRPGVVNCEMMSPTLRHSDTEEDDTEEFDDDDQAVNDAKPHHNHFVVGVNDIM